MSRKIEITPNSFNSVPLLEFLLTDRAHFSSATKRDCPPFFLSTRNSRSRLQHYLDEIKEFTNKSTIDKTEIAHVCIENSDLPSLPDAFIVKPRDVLIGGGKDIFISKTRVDNETHFSQVIRTPTVFMGRGLKWDCRYLAWIIRNEEGDVMVNFCSEGIIRTASEPLCESEPTLKQVLTNIGFHETDPERFVPPRLIKAPTKDVACMTEILQKMSVRVSKSEQYHPSLVILGMDIMEGWCIEVNHHPFMSFTADDAEGTMCRIAGKMIASDILSMFP